MESLPSPGRVFFGAGAASAGETGPLPGFDYAVSAPSNAAQEGVRGNLERTPMSEAYFSAANFQIIQNGIRRKVYDESGKIIDPVNRDDLFIIMRAMYLQYARNAPTQIPEQIAEINDRVIAWAVPKIVAELSMYKMYLHDISTLPTPMTHPVNISSAGSRSLPFKPFF